MTSITTRRDYRRLSRLIKQHPNLENLHKQRIAVALQFTESEATQGALADYFYGCWYNVPFFATEILQQTQSKLRPNILKSFQSLQNSQNYLFKVNTLATGWSVLTTPSLAVSSHRLKTSTDFSMSKVKMVVANLLSAKSTNDIEKISTIEDEFFSYCLMCDDNVAFMKAWLQLGKLGWEFSENWEKTGNNMK